MGERRFPQKTTKSDLHQSRDQVIDSQDYPVEDYSSVPGKVPSGYVYWYLWEYDPASDRTACRSHALALSRPRSGDMFEWLSEQEHTDRLMEDGTMVRRIK
jgi:hypothetical protein